MELYLPRDKKPGANYRYQEMSVLDLGTRFEGKDPWQLLAVFMTVWLSRYHDDCPISIARVRKDITESIKVEVQSHYRWTDVEDHIKAQPWDTSDKPAKLLIQVSGEACVMGQPELLLRLNQQQLILGYNAESFTESTISRLSGHLARIIHQSHPELSISEMNYMSQREWRQVVDEFNNTTTVSQGADPIFALENLANVNPDGLAIKEGNITVTYSQLLDRINLLGSAIQEHGLEGDVVGVYLPRSRYTVIALMAIWHAGCAWLPLSMDYPASLLEHMCADNNVKLIVRLSEFSPSFEIAGIRELHLDQLPENKCVGRCWVDADSIAAVMYTSGSTGQPKGISHSHRALQNRFSWWVNSYPVEEGDILTQRTALSFIPSLWEMVSGVLNAKPLVIVDDATARNPLELLKLIHESACTRIGLLPSFLKLILDTVEDVEIYLDGVKQIVVAGEPMPTSLCKRISAIIPGVLVINDYGCTEVNGVLGCDSVGGRVVSDHLPAGKPINNCKAYILDTTGSPVPIGVIGELYISGVAVGDGYINLPQQNEEKFILKTLIDPQGESRNVRLFRTFDRARWLAAGQIEVLGRCDNVVKVRGIRVELEAVEKALLNIDGVRESAAAAEKDTNGNSRLIAWVVADDLEDLPSYASIRSRLSKMLPDACLPSVIHSVKQLPRTANGKLNRAGLLTLSESEYCNRQKKTIIGKTDTKDHSAIVGAINEVLARVLGCSAADIDSTREFKLLGLDSVSAVVFAKEAAQALHCDVPVTVLFEATTPERLANHLGGFRQTRVQENTRTVSADIAVVGMACQMPGADNIEEFWQNLVEGKDLVTTIPEDRWRWEDFYSAEKNVPQKSISKWGAFLTHYDQFDPRFFHLSANEARLMAPDQRIFLETCWQTIENAGYNEEQLSGEQIAVYVGARTPDYPELIAESDIDVDAMSLMGNDNAMLAARIAYYMNFTGPVMTVDTACSSSLVAIHLACESLRRGDSRMAIAGGVSLVTTSTQYLVNTNAGMLSPNGRCATFDNSADGFVQGEGCGAILLKPLQEAKAENDRIYCVIKASGVNQDGKTNGITAPNGEAQRVLLDRVYRDGGISPADIGQLEAHGTGTKLGDPIEFQALSEVYRAWTEERSYCALGSVKTNIGHLIAAAGIAGFIKTALSIYHRYLPRSLHFNQCNEHINIESSPFYINTEGKAWNKKEGKRKSAISAFGFSGTNCHLVLEEVNKQSLFSEDDSGVSGSGVNLFHLPILLPISAKKDSSLQRMAANLCEFISSKKSEFDSKKALLNLSYSLFRRFNNFDYRLLICAESTQHIAEALRAVSEEKAHHAILYCGKSESNMSSTDFIDLCKNLIQDVVKAKRKADDEWRKSLGVLFRGGVNLPLGDFFPSDVRLLDLPCYVFDHRRYWISDLVSVQPEEEKYVNRIKSVNLNGLKGDKNDSSQILIKSICGEDFSGHCVNRRIWLPATAQYQFLESAVIDAYPDTKSIHIKQWNLLSACELNPTKAFEIKIQLEKDRFIILSRDSTIETAKEKAHSIGHFKASHSSLANQKQIKLNEWKKHCTKTYSKIDFYDHCRTLGLQYGSGYQRVASLAFSDHKAISLVSLKDKERDYSDKANIERLKIELLDSALQTAICLSSKSVLQVPASIDELAIDLRLPSQLFVCAEKVRENNSSGKHESSTDGSTIVNLWLCGKDGNIFGWALGIKLAKINNMASSEQSTLEKIGSEVNVDKSILEMPKNNRLAPHIWLPKWENVELTFSEGNDSSLVNKPIGVFNKIIPEFARGLDLYRPLDREVQSQSSIVPDRWLWVPEGKDLRNKVIQFVENIRFLAENNSVASLLILLDRKNHDGHALRGAISCLKKEIPSIHCRLVELDINEVEAPTLIRLIASEFDDDDRDDRGLNHETHVRYRSEKRSVKKWAYDECGTRNNSIPEYFFDTKDAPVCLITGGLGGIGRSLAQYLFEKFSVKLVLIGRSELSREASDWLFSIRSKGCEAVYLRADMADGLRCERAFRQTEMRFGRVDHIYHCAGVTADSLVYKKTEAEITRVVNAKVASTLAIESALENRSIQLFVLFSSISSVLGTPGQSDYACANAWLDDFAFRWNQKQLKNGYAISINWGLWECAGMQPPKNIEQQLQNDYGMYAMPAVQGFEKIYELAGRQVSNATIVYGKKLQLDKWLLPRKKVNLPQLEEA